MTFAKRLFDFIRASMLNHKKKLIGLTLLALVVYYIKKKMTLERLVIIAEKLLSFAEYLPLPDAPSYRPVHPIEKVEPSVYPVLKSLINIDELKQRIRNKEVDQWDKLKQNVLVGYGCVVSLFDISEILKILECKYADEFVTLGAQESFKSALAQMQQNFNNNLKLLFDYVKTSLKMKLDKIDISKEYTKNELYALLKDLSQTLFEDKYNVYERYKIKKNRKLIDNEVQRLFFTSLEKTEVKPGKIRRFFRFISSALSFETKDIEFDISDQRFQVVRQMFLCQYVHVHKLTMTFEMNSKGQQLFELVYKEYEDLTESLNFHTLALYFAQYQTMRFINRCELYMQSKKLERIKMISALSVIYKIIIQEYLNEDSWSKNKVFLTNEIKEALKLQLSDKDKEVDPAIQEEIRKRNIFLNELQAMKRIEFAKNQLFLKYFYERSGVDTMKDQNENMDFEAKQLMSYLSRDK